MSDNAHGERPYGMPYRRETLDYLVQQARDGDERAFRTLVSGFFIVRAADDPAAIAIARESPHLRYGGSILVRRIE